MTTNFQHKQAIIDQANKVINQSTHYIEIIEEKKEKKLSIKIQIPKYIKIDILFFKSLIQEMISIIDVSNYSQVFDQLFLSITIYLNYKSDVTISYNDNNVVYEVQYIQF